MTIKRNELTKQAIIELLNASAKEASIMFNCSLIVSDMVYALWGFSGWETSRNNEPYYVWIREQGVEDGTLEHVEERCKVLGYPIIMYKIERDGFYFNVEKTHK